MFLLFHSLIKQMFTEDLGTSCLVRVGDLYVRDTAPYLGAQSTRQASGMQGELAARTELWDSREQGLLQVQGLRVIWGRLPTNGLK